MMDLAVVRSAVSSFRPLALRPALVVGLLLLLSSSARAEQATVHLKQGGQLTGDLLDYVPGNHVTIGLGEGRRIELQDSEVLSLELGAGGAHPSAATPGAWQPSANSATAQRPSTSADSFDNLPYAAQAWRASARLAIGFGGGLNGTVGGDKKDPEDLAATYGFELGLEAPLHEYFTLGAVLRFSKWNVNASDADGVGRSTLWDLAVLPKVRYPFLVDARLMEVYVGVPIGAGLNILNDGIKLDRGTDSSTIGFNIGVLTGFNVFVSERVALGLELGYEYYSFSFTGHGEDPETLELSIAQFRLSGGVTVTL
jgi:hypothetical protein